jgi:hypothetical protein
MGQRLFDEVRNLRDLVDAHKRIYLRQQRG